MCPGCVLSERMQAHECADVCCGGRGQFTRDSPQRYASLGELPSAIPVSTAPLTKAYRLAVTCTWGLSPPSGLSVTSGREEGGPQNPNIVVSGCGRLLFRRALVLPVRLRADHLVLVHSVRMLTGSAPHLRPTSGCVCAHTAAVFAPSAAGGVPVAC